MCLFFHTEVISGKSAEKIVWSINNPSGQISPPVFYRVPDGGSYDSSHMISSNDPGYDIGPSSLTLLNVGPSHEGKYYCVFGGQEVEPVMSSPCIIVKGTCSSLL